MDNLTIASEWFAYAEADITSAKFLRNMSPVPNGVICFLCEQSAEKLLKGFLALDGKEIPKTHDLMMLNRMCCTIDREFVQIEEDCFMLTDYSVSARYHFRLDLNESDMNSAIEQAERIRTFIRKKANIF